MTATFIFWLQKNKNFWQKKQEDAQANGDSHTKDQQRSKLRITGRFVRKQWLTVLI